MNERKQLSLSSIITPDDSDSQPGNPKHETTTPELQVVVDTMKPGAVQPISISLDSDASEYDPHSYATTGRLRFTSKTHYIFMLVTSMLTLATGSTYLGWKITTFILNSSQIVPAGVVLLFMEVILFFTTLMTMVEVGVPIIERPESKMAENGPFPTVAIFVCCCNEKLDVIQDTVRGALSQNYPVEKFKVMILDDGGDDNLKAWVESQMEKRSQTLEYIRRPKQKGVPHYFKAGNINYGLTLINTDFVAMFDADMIPLPNFLTSMLPHFTSMDIAFVQCPQAFYNIPKGDPLADSNQNFFDVILPYRDARYSAQCVGTGVIMRTQSLREIGGITTGSITEDFDTSMTFHSRGYNSVYVRQRLQAGLAPWNLEGYIKQHQRWTSGNLQILKRNPLFLRDHFPLFLRLGYWYGGAQCYLCIITLMMLILPIVIVACDLPIMVQTDNSISQRMFIILLVPYIAACRIFCFGLTIHLKDPFMVHLTVEQAWYWMAYFNMGAILKSHFPFVSKRFRATGSLSTSRSVYSRLKTLWFHITYVIAVLAVVILKLSALNLRDCGQIMKTALWSIFMLFCLQNMLVPICHVMNNDHPKPEQRRSMLEYDEHGVPRVRPEQLLPQYSKKFRLYLIIPALWVVGSIFFFVAAIVDLKPGFCKAAGFFENRFF